MLLFAEGLAPRERRGSPGLPTWARGDRQGPLTPDGPCVRQTCFSSILSLTFSLVSGPSSEHKCSHLEVDRRGMQTPPRGAALSPLPSLPSPRPPRFLSVPSPHPSLQESCSLAVQGLGLASDVASLWTAVTSRISLWLPGCGLRRGLRRSASLSRLTAGVWMPIPRCDPKGTQRKIQ